MISAPGEPVFKRVIYGTEAALDFEKGICERGKGVTTTIGDLKAGFLQSLSSEERGRYFPLGLTDDIAQEVFEFVTACGERDGKVEVDGWEGYRSQAVCMAVYESAHLGRAVTRREVESLEVEAYQGELNQRWSIS